MTVRSEARVEFLSYLLDAAIEHTGYGAFNVTEYDVEVPGKEYAVIVFDREDYPLTDDERQELTHRVDIDTMAKGLGILKRAVARVPEGDDPDGGRAYCDPDTGKTLHFPWHAYADLMLANRTNGDDGDYDVVGALGVLECGLFGRVVYA